MVTDTPTDGQCNYEYSPDDKYRHDSGYCEGHPMDNGRCYHHGGKNENGGAPAGNTNAADHGAWSKSFVEDFLREDEIERVRQAEDLLGEPETAQDVGRTAAAIALEQFRRTGDDRFLRRYESICDTFGIAPAERKEIEHSGEGGGPVTIRREVVDVNDDGD